MRHTLFLHFGLHKTGTKSIQRYLGVNAREFAARGITVFRDIELCEGRLSGRSERTNCFQVAHLLLRPELDTISRLRGLAIRPDPETSAGLVHAVNAVLRGGPNDVVVMSSESFSLLRTAGERRLLEDMLAGTDLRPLGFFRSRKDWMRSWRAQVAKSGVLDGYEPGDRPNTFDFSDRSWLLDHDALRRFWGPRGRYLSYDRAVARDGTVIPAFLRALGLDPARMPDCTGIWRNPTGVQQ